MRGLHFFHFQRQYLIAHINNLHYEKFQDGTVKCIEEEIPFEVPDGWAWARLNSIVDVRDGTHNTPAYVDKGIPLITSKNLVEGGIDYSNVKYISKKDAININERSGVNIGDILFAMIGTIGNPSMVTEDILISIKNVALFKFTFSDNLNNHFIMYFLDCAQKDMKKRPSGGLQPFVSLNFLRTYLVPVPPVEEQQRIVDILTDSINRIRNIDILKNELTISIENAKSKILDLAISGKLVLQDPNEEPASVLLERIRTEKETLIKAGKIKRDKKESIIFKGDDNSYYRYKGENVACIDNDLPYELPNGWIWAILPEVVDFQEGPGILKKDFRDDGVPLIRISGLQSDKVLLEGCNYLDPVMVENKWKHFKLELGDVILCTSASIGKASIVGSEAVGAIPYTGQIRFKMSNAIIREYFLYFANSNIYLNQINRMKTGNCIQHYGPTHLKEVYIPIPPIKEQERIVKKISSFLSLIYEIKENTNI